MGYYSSTRRQKADAYLPAQLPIIANHFNYSTEELRLGTLEEDLCAATDVVLPNGKTVGVRVRSPEQMKHYGDLLIRHQPNSAFPTEYDKLLNGTPDYLLYCIAKDATQLRSWWIINPTAIRKAHQNGWAFTTMPQHICYGNEGMMCFKMRGFLSNPPLVLSSSDSLPLNNDRLIRHREIQSRYCAS